nr:PD-(D/E)XK nuclease family transposase [Candidatus Electrothrix aestuarii]
MVSKERYINLLTDYGFKKIFGEEPNKNLLLDFLNELLKEEQGEIRE